MTDTSVYQAILDVLHERNRQQLAEGFSCAHDDEHQNDELAIAAACYALEHGNGNAARSFWPFDWSWWKPSDHRRNCVKAAAMLIAEIERIDRAAEK